MANGVYTKRNGEVVTGSAMGANLWDHPSHQPAGTKGCFTQTSAVEHQKAYDVDGWCDCIKFA